MTIGGSILLIVAGAILRYAITWSPNHVDLQLIGLILMLAGIAGLIIALTFLFMRRRRLTPPDEVYEERRYTEPPRPYDDSQRRYSEPPRPYDDPQRRYSGPPPYDDPQRPSSGPPRPYDEPTRPYGESDVYQERRYSDPPL
jgi:hypothetical protein